MNARQKQFVTEYVIDKNATQAAIRAGYSEKTAESQGSRLLRNVKVSEMINKLFKEIRQNNISDAIEVEEFLSLSMKGEIKEEVVVTENTGDYMSKARIIKKQISAKDRIKAAELLGKRHDLFTDKKEIDVNVKSNKLDAIIEQLKE